MNSLELFPTPLLHCPSCLAHFQLSIMSHNTVTSEAFRILDSAESLMVYKACFVHNNPLLDTCKHLAKKTVNFHLFSILSLSIFQDHRNDYLTSISSCLHQMSPQVSASPVTVALPCLAHGVLTNIVVFSPGGYTTKQGYCLTQIS